jgi:polyhydroxyalkanoate synthase subunit PhaC
MLSSFFMSRTFSFLRSNDLIYGPAIRSYMMGEAPPAFDLLYWNGDSTNLPARMSVEYLRGSARATASRRAASSCWARRCTSRTSRCRSAPWPARPTTSPPGTASYDGVRRMGSKSKTFILSESGHIAGIVNPPSQAKYGHYTNEDLALDAGRLAQGADFHEGSWWPRWEAWLAKRSGRRCPRGCRATRRPSGARPAPGTYVIAGPRRPDRRSRTRIRENFAAVQHSPCNAAPQHVYRAFARMRAGSRASRRSPWLRNRRTTPR